MTAEEIFKETKEQLDKFAVLAAELDQNDAFLKMMRRHFDDDPDMMEAIEEAERDLASSREHMELGRARLEPLRKLFY